MVPAIEFWQSISLKMAFVTAANYVQQSILLNEIIIGFNMGSITILLCLNMNDFCHNRDWKFEIIIE